MISDISARNERALWRPDTDATEPEEKVRSAMAPGFTRLSALLLVLTALAAGVGAFGEGVYRDNPLVRAGWIGNDLVTLFVAVPLLAVATVLARRGSTRGALLWSGVAAYTLYGYAFYAFGAAFNGLHLVYVAILVASTFGLLLALTSSAVCRIGRGVAPDVTLRTAAALILLVSALLGAFWTLTSIGFLWTGEPPAMVAATGHPTNVTGALDLWLVVAFGLLGAIRLWLGCPWGYVIATVWSVKGMLYMPALSAASIVQFLSGATNELTQLALWVPIGLISALCSWVLLRARPR